MSWITNVEAAAGSFVTKEWAKITGDATAVESALENAANVGIGIVSGLKNWLATPTGQTVEAVVTNIPGVGPYAVDVLNFLPTLLIDLGLAKAEFTKSPEQVVIDGFTNAVNANTADVKATHLNSIASNLTKFVSGLSGAEQSIQSALSATPAIYAGVAPVTVP